MFSIKKLEVEETYHKSKLKLIREELALLRSKLSSPPSSLSDSKQEEKEKAPTKKKPTSASASTSPSKKDCGSISSFGGGKRPNGYVPFSVVYHHGRDEVENKEDFRAPMSRLELFYRQAGDAPTYQHMINAVCQDKQLKEPIRGNTRNFIITRRISNPDVAVFGRVMDQAPVVMDYDKHHVQTGVLYDMWPYQVVNNAKPIITVTALVDSKQVIVDDSQLICVSKPWVNELVKKRSQGYLSYSLNAFGKSRDDGIRFRNIPHLSFSSKNNSKSGYVIFGMTRDDQEIYNNQSHSSGDGHQKWYDDKDDSEGMAIQGLPSSFFVSPSSSSSSSSASTKKKQQKKRKRQEQEQEKEEKEKEKKQEKEADASESDSESDSDSGDELPDPKRPKSRPQAEVYDEDYMDEIPLIVDAGCNGTYNKTVKIVAHFIASERKQEVYPSLLTSRAIQPEPFAFIQGATMKHLDAFVTSHFIKGEHDMFSLGMGVRVTEDGNSYVLQTEPLVVDGGIYHYYLFGWPGSVPIVSRVRITQHRRDWTVVDFNFVCCKELSDMVLDSFPQHDRFDWTAQVCYFINSLASEEEESNKTRIEHVTLSRVHDMRTRYQAIMGQNQHF